MWGEEGLPSWELVLLVLSSQEGMLLGWTVLTSWEAALSLRFPPWELVLLALPSQGVLLRLASWDAALSRGSLPGS